MNCVKEIKTVNKRTKGKDYLYKDQHTNFVDRAKVLRHT